MDIKIITATTSALEALDLTAENARSDALRSDIAMFQAAMETADTRCSEIARELNNWTGPDASAVADALLAQVDASDAAAAGVSRESLTEERDALSAGMRDLQRRQEDARRELEDIEMNTYGRAADVVKPVIVALQDDARKAAQVLVDSYVALSAINAATKGGLGEVNQLRKAVEAVTGFEALAQSERTRHVQPEITAMLANLDGKGSALPYRVPSIIYMP